MEISNDRVRRQLRGAVKEQSTAMRSMRDLVARLFDDGSTVAPAAKADIVLGGFNGFNGFNRRRFLQIGGLSIASVAVLAACGSDDDDDTAGGTTATTAATGAGGADVLILRTASSLERYAVVLYDTAIASGLVETAAVGDAAKLFREQHLEHALLFEGATEATAPGQAFRDPNPAVAAMLQSRVDALRTERDVIKLAYDVESVAAATYFSTVGAFDDKNLNVSVMSVGGVEARHVAILGGVLMASDSPAYPTSGFQTADGAVKAGTGVS
ncbi:MAG TPA: ferritin-like domain-containing protein [Acidimicrobiales bacterium]